ncbi:MAG: PepSY domain-containing protein [Gammaproteobacteria bacterium]
MLKRMFAMAVLSWSLLAVAGAVSAQPTLPQAPSQNQLDRAAPGNPIRDNAQATSRITERQAVNLARQRFPGNILRISLVGEGQNQRYQIRMENEGKVFTVFVHATTGRVTGGT